MIVIPPAGVVCGMANHDERIDAIERLVSELSLNMAVVRQMLDERLPQQLSVRLDRLEQAQAKRDEDARQIRVWSITTGLTAITAIVVTFWHKITGANP